MAAVRCVVFDVDDTLYLERDYVRSGFAAAGLWAAERLGVRDLASRAWAEFEAGRRGDIFDRVLERCSVPRSAEVIDALVRAYRAHRPTIALLPDARACLDLLRGRCALAALTDGPVESQRAKEDALGLGAWLHPIVLTAALGDGFGKPSPRGFRRIEAAAGLSGSECAYVADNPAKDFGGPAALGWRRVRVRRAGALHAAVDSGPLVQLELRDLAGLATALEIAK